LGCKHANEPIAKLGNDVAANTVACLISRIRSQQTHAPALHHDAKLTAAARYVLVHRSFALSQVQAELERVGYIVHGHPWGFARCTPEGVPRDATPASLANHVLGHEAFVWGPSYRDIGVVIVAHRFYGLGGFSDAPGH
jgi:hypothetical protein